VAAGVANANEVLGGSELLAAVVGGDDLLLLIRLASTQNNDFKVTLRRQKWGFQSYVVSVDLVFAHASFEGNLYHD